ncbi:MAG: helix-turn-helix transcriptional regulator [bacterium]|nr:helix-turn-helix transcriptional regulator [bacterium]
MNNSNMNKISEQLGKNMKRIRAKKGMSQGDIARALEVDRGYISNIENGKKNPTIATIQKLANALGIPSSELLK